MAASLSDRLSDLLVLGGRASGVLQRDRGPFQALRARFYRELWARASQRVGARANDLGDGLLRLQRSDRWTVVRGSSVALDSQVVLRLAGHKAISLRLFEEAGLPVPRHTTFDLPRLEVAYAFLREIGGPVVVKPAAAGSAGRGVTTGVRTEGQLRRAALRAAAGGRELLVEQQVEGASHRLLYLNGELIDAVRRDPPTVLGDGRSTVRELVRAETNRRLKGPIVSMHPLRVDAELRRHLALRGLGLRSVVAAGERLAVKRVVNQNAARENVRVLGEVHEDVVRAGREAARALGVALAGVDVLTPDAQRPLAEAGGVVGEVNTTPALHHHVLTADQAGAEAPDVGVPARILEHLLGEADG